MVVHTKREFTLDYTIDTTTATLTSDSGSSTEKNGSNNGQMVPRAILMCRENSHPFQDRHLIPSTPIKIGRCVARSRQATDNAIFDCKVLSRNHALLWYENGKFYLQDTRSSNGTFVNNQRLSKGSEESAPKELCSGDVVQFGVDVVENSRKVTHGCIVATLKLILPDGKEAKASSTTSVAIGLADMTISSQDLYQIYQYIQEALHREQLLETKLVTLQQIVALSAECNNSNWKAMIGEDRLLSRIETLESQAQVYSKNMTEDKLKEGLVKVQEERDKFQMTAKESLQKALQEKLESIRKVQDLEISLGNTESECTHLRELSESTEKEINIMADKYDEAKKEAFEYSKKLTEAEEKLEEIQSKSSEEKSNLEIDIEEMRSKETLLTNQKEALQAEYDFLKERFNSLQNRLDESKENQDDSECNEKQSEGTQSDSKLNSLFIEGQDEIHKLKDQLRLSKEDEEITKTHAQELEAELNRLKSDLGRVEPENEKNDVSIKEYPETNGELGQLDLLHKEISTLKELLYETREEKKTMEQELALLKGTHSALIDKITKLEHDRDELLSQIKSHMDNICSLEEKLVFEHKENSTKEQHIASLVAKLSLGEGSLNALQKEITSLEEQLTLIKEGAKENICERANDARDNDQDSVIEDNKHLKAKLYAIEEEIKRYKSVEVMQSHTAAQNEENHSTSESIEKDLEEQNLELREKLVELCEKYFKCNQDKTTMKQDMDVLNEDYNFLKSQTRMIGAFTIVPIILILGAIFLSVYSFLASFTMTQEPL